MCVTVADGLGFTCMEASNGQAALSLLEEQPAHIILTDLVMPQMSGIEFLDRVRKMLPRAEVAVMTGHGSVETAVQAMKLGAYDYIAKPFSAIDELRLFLPAYGGKSSAGRRESSSFANVPTPKPSCMALSAPRQKFRMCCA